ncbi:MAG: DUF523 and DUF1722 domain-containing protein [Candidatus Thiodiazotropha lotti]|nr:DUF523 and DUF1722 domain-containing protein [Candidatus Thiodiazotropha lotti]
MSQSDTTKPIIGLSACLLGHQVRYDGGHKRDRFIAEILQEHVEYHPLCPETGIGLGVPRPTIRLIGDPDRPRLVGVADPSQDYTRQMQAYTLQQTERLSHLSGYILKKNSPSCGMSRVKVFSEQGTHAQRKGSGIFAQLLMEKLPQLPLEEEGRLNDPVLRENFINRIYVYHRWHHLRQQGLSAAKLIDFHTNHKYLVMAHSQAAYQRLGRLLSNLAEEELDQIAATYIEALMQTLKRRVTRSRHVNVLQHIMGYLKKRIDTEDKSELVSCIEAYRRMETPLVVPMTLLKHYFRRHPDDYMSRQIYLQPHPEKLGLRNLI